MKNTLKQNKDHPLVIHDRVFGENMSENKPKLQDLFIGIAGLIGAGKSTLATALRELTWTSCIMNRSGQ